MPNEDFLLLNPGPVPVHESVREAMTAPMVSHRSADFSAVYRRAQEGLDYVFSQSTPDESVTNTDGTSLILNGTATMGMEAAVSNLVDPHDEVVALVNGKFGRRFARIADRYCRVTRVDVDWGESIPVDAVADAVSDETAAVTMVHNETSTGLLNPVEAVGAIADEHDAAFVVDGVTSLGGDAFYIDDWGVDIAVTDAQKALAAPPGLSAVYVTDGITDKLDGERGPFYSDLEWHLRKEPAGQTPFTSAVPLFRAMAVAVERIQDEGIGNRIARHRRQAAAFRAGFAAMGLDRFPTPTGETELSNTVTAIALPEAVREDPDGFFQAVADRNTGISGGQAHLGGQIFRVSNMGELTDDQVRRGVRVIGEAMNEAGVDVNVESALEAAGAELGAPA